MSMGDSTSPYLHYPASSAAEGAAGKLPGMGLGLDSRVDLEFTRKLFNEVFYFTRSPHISCSICHYNVNS